MLSCTNLLSFLISLWGIATFTQTFFTVFSVFQLLFTSQCVGFDVRLSAWVAQFTRVFWAFECGCYSLSVYAACHLGKSSAHDALYHGYSSIFFLSTPLRVSTCSDTGGWLSGEWLSSGDATYMIIGIISWGPSNYIMGGRECHSMFHLTYLIGVQNPFQFSY